MPTLTSVIESWSRMRRASQVAGAGFLPVAMLSVSIATAATPLKVRVVIEPTVDSSAQPSTLAALWGTAAPTIEQRAAQLVTPKLASMFAEWDFGTSPTRYYATLRLRFVEFANAPQTVFLRLEGDLGDHQEQARPIASIEWVHPGDVPLGNVPVRERAAEMIAATIAALDTPGGSEKQNVLNWLFTVPIGSGGKWVDHPPPPSLADVRLAAQLPATRFDRLAGAKMKVTAKPSAAGAEIELSMRGTGDRQDLSLPDGSIPAVLLKPDWNDLANPSLPALLNYRVGVIYLLEEGNATEEGFFDVQ